LGEKEKQSSASAEPNPQESEAVNGQGMVEVAKDEVPVEDYYSNRDPLDREYGPCCHATMKLVIPIKERKPGGNETHEFKPIYCALCGNRL